MDAFACETCGFDLWLPVAKLQVSHLGLYNDGRFPGRCILAFEDHEEHLDDLDSPFGLLFMLDIQKAGQAIRKATGCERLNYAILGNTEPHVHAHLIPRYKDDPVITRPIWEHPDKKFKMSDSEVSDLIQKIKINL
jgi:diadenosine tetraphosphate (Ap4A) HIT family hydrolase